MSSILAPATEARAVDSSFEIDHVSEDGAEIRVPLDCSWSDMDG